MLDRFWELNDWRIQILHFKLLIEQYSEDPEKLEDA